MNALDTQKLLSSKEVAAALGLHPKTVFKWAAEGRIPSIKVGRSRRFYMRDVMAALGEGEA